jgi:Fe-Mn family superoxide dismutase
MKNINRRSFISKVGVLGIGGIITSLSLKNNLLNATILNSTNTNMFILPELPYTYSSLEPFIDKETMLIHHTKHHQAYINNLNKLIISESIPTNTIENILNNISNYSTSVRNNAGGHYNHSLFWQLLTPIKNDNAESFKINEAIVKKFGSMENFKVEFEKKVMSVFGSGWCWLILNEANQLEIITTANQDNPLMPVIIKNASPLLALDIWEHAYYLKYQNKRADYLKAWWQIVNWKFANTLYTN